MRNEASKKSYALKKAIGFSAIHFAVGMTLAYVLTGQWAVALGVALIEPVINAGIIYFYSRYELGREKPEIHRGGLVSGGAF
ncbi:MAG: DUF2061 domain-containing protein [Parvibaculum sp.]|nr:DUF2061 domain-containing protein [Parvibaculum sp.]